MRTRRLPHAGFTLVEVLVALSVFAVVSALAYTGLARALETKDRLDKERAFWSQMSLAFVRIDQDLAAARSRSALDADGTPLPAFAGKSGADQASLEFTRSATPGLGAPGLQRVGYEISDHTLWRVTWSAVDRSPATRPTRSALINDIDGFSVRFHGEAGATSGIWPAGKVLEELPRGLEMTLTIPGRGAFSRAFFIHD